MFRSVLGSTIFGVSVVWWILYIWLARQKLSVEEDVTSRLYFSKADSDNPTNLRRKRKVIVAFPYNGETVTVDSKLVDILIVAESRFSQRGGIKSANKWGEKSVKAKRVVHTVLNQNFYSIQNKWGQEVQIRRHLGTVIKDLYKKGEVIDDDVVVVVDADEVINDMTLYNLGRNGLKNRTVAEANLIWNLYNRCWVHQRETRVKVAVSVLTLRNEFNWNTHLVRASRSLPYISLELAGYHCSWCFFSPSQFREKIKFMTDGDATPYPMYENENWSNKKIDFFMKNGLWLDGNVHGKYVC